MSIFYAAYPGLKLSDVSYAVFRGLVDRADRTRAFLRGQYSQEMQHSDIVEKDNRTIIMKARFPTIFPEVNFDG